MAEHVARAPFDEQIIHVMSRIERIQPISFRGQMCDFRRAAARMREENTTCPFDLKRILLNSILRALDVRSASPKRERVWRAGCDGQRGTSCFVKSGR